jgi:hypothetical protein
VSFAGLAPRAETTTVEVETETEETKKCAKCDAMQKASANFCSACGASMKDEDEPDDDDDEEPEARAASLETRSRGRRASADFHTLLGAPVRAPAAARPAPDPLASARAEGTRIANELMGRGPDPMAPIPIAGTRYDPGFEAESTHPVMLDPAVSARENFIKAFNVPPGLAARLDNKTLLSMTGAHVAALKGPRR